MGVCYSVQQDWQDDVVQVSSSKKARRKKKKHFSIIQQQKSQYDASFVSILEDQYRNSLYQTIDQSSQVRVGNSTLSNSIVMGSVVEMSIQQQQNLIKNLTTLNANNQPHSNQKVRLCNFKTKNFLHTHRVKLQKSHHFNQVSCCPYDTNHNIDYDTWVLNPSTEHKEGDYFSIYHPFTKRYLIAIEDMVAAGDEEFVWEVEALGVRRNQGFVRIKCEEGYLHMTDSKGLIKGHRSVSVTRGQHISNLWELMFV